MAVVRYALGVCVDCVTDALSLPVDAPAYYGPDYWHAPPKRLGEAVQECAEALLFDGMRPAIVRTSEASRAWFELRPAVAGARCAVHAAGEVHRELEARRAS